MARGFAAERRRLATFPESQAPPVLVALTVTPAGDADEYASRLRELIAAALVTAEDADFDEEVDVSALPSWFLAVDSGGDGVPQHVASGQAAYLRDREGAFPWTAGEWISCFDQLLRRWGWWALVIDERKLRLWVDTNGEPVVPMEELWWALYISGAERVEGPQLVQAIDWIRRAKSL